MQLVNPNPASPAITENTSVEIEFPLDEFDQGQFRLAGTLAHVSLEHFGLKLDTMPVNAYQALVAARAGITDPLPVSSLMADEKQAILRDCLHLFHHFMDRVWRHFLDTISRTLNSEDTGSLTLAERSRYTGSLASLFHQGETQGQALYASLIKQIHQIGQPKTEPEPVQLGLDELTIVDDASFNDWLNMAGIYNRIEIDNNAAIYQFEHRLSRLTPVAIDKHNDPFGPQTVCLAFQDSIKDLDLTNEMRAKVYKLFGYSLAAHYPELYEQFLSLLSPLKPAQVEPFRPGNQHGGGSVSHAAKQTQAPAPDLTDQVSKLAEIAEKLFALTPGARTESAAPATPAMAAPERPGLDPEDLQILRHTLSRQAQSMPAHMEAIEDSRNLEAILANAPAGASLTERMLAFLSQDSSGRLDHHQRDSLGAASNLMNQVLAETATVSELDSLLKRLEKPLYELVLRGEDPLNQPDHPLCQLINLVDRFAILTDDQGRFTDRETGKLLHTVIDHAADQFTTDPDSFSKAINALEKLLKYPSQYHRQRIAGHQQGIEAQALIRQARMRAAAQLDSLLVDRPIPKVVFDLVEQGLKQHLVLNHLRHLETECLATQQLIEAILSKDQQPVAKAVIGEVDTRLRSSNIDRARIDASVAALTSHLAMPGPGEQVQLTTGWYMREADPTAQQDTARPGLADRPSRLGEWWEFVQGDQNQPMQLIWIDQDGEAFGFVNRAAIRNVHLTADELAHRQLAGTVRRGEDRDLPLLERSENSAVDNLYRRLARQALNDPATDLPNRKGFLRAVTRHNRRDSGTDETVGLIETVQFRAVQDSCGSEAATRLARELAQAIKPCLMPDATLAWLGDGRYAILFETDLESAQKIANNILLAIRAVQFRHGENRFPIDARIGLTKLMTGTADPESALQRAGLACVAAERGGESVQSYENSGDAMREQVSLQTWGRRINSLLEGDGMFLRCQQIAPLATDTTALAYYEILLGVRDEHGNVVSPQPFVEAVEHWQRHRDLDLWVLDQSFAWIRQNQAIFNACGGFSINLSAQSVGDETVLSMLQRSLEPGDIDASKIMFEITETATVDNFDAARDFIRKLRLYGCRFCIDDFGSGNASYGYLRNLRTDTLKIDGIFIKDMLTEPDLLAMVKSMNDIAHSLDMKTVAEFVATPELVALAREIGIDYGQGYAIARPVPLDELANPA